MAPREKREVIRSEMRLPPDVHEALAESADDNERSMNAELVAILRKALAARLKRGKA